MTTGQLNGGLDFLRLMAIDTWHYVPAVGLEALGGVVGESALHLAIDRDTVVVVEDDQLAKPLGTCQRSDLMGDALHQSAITDKTVGVMVDNSVVRAVKLCSQGTLCHRHPNGIG